MTHFSDEFYRKHQQRVTGRDPFAPDALVSADATAQRQLSSEGPSWAPPLDPRVAPQLTLLELRTITLVVPMPPSVNDLYGVNHQTGAKFLQPDQRSFRRNVVGIGRLRLRGLPPLAGRLELMATFYFADRRRADISNRVKALEDALKHASVYLDDSQIDREVIERVVRPGAEECAVTVREIAV